MEIKLLLNCLDEASHWHVGCRDHLAIVAEEDPETPSGDLCKARNSLSDGPETVMAAKRCYITT
jgi:hypothetical protein